MAATVAELIAKISVQGADAAKAQLIGMGDAVKGAGLAFSGLALGGIAVAGAALIGIGVAGVKSAADFQQIMLQTQALANVTKGQAQAASVEIMKMATAIGQTPQQLAQGFYYIASTGVSAKDSLIELNLAARAAAVGNTQTEVTANALTAVLATYGLAAKDAARITDEMVASVSAGKTEFPDYAKVIGVIATNAKQAGISFEEATAAFSALSNVMSPKQAKDAADALLQTTSRFTVLEARAKSLGLAFDLNAYKSMNLEQRLKYLQQITGGNSEEISKLIGRQNAMAAFTDLSAAHFDTYNKTLEQVRNSHGALDQAFAKTSQGFNATMDRVKAAGQVFLIAVGNQILPLLTQLGSAVAPIISSFADWITKTGILTNVMNGVTGVIHQIIDAFNAVFNPVQQATAVTKQLADSFDRATGIFHQVKQAAQPLFDTFDRAHGIISSTSNAVNPMLDSFDRASGVFNKTGTGAHGVVQAVNPFVAIFQGIKTVIEAAIPVVQGIGTAMQFVGQHWSQIQSVIQTVGNIISTVIRAVGVAIDFVKQHIGQVLPVFQAVGNFLSSTFAPVWRQLVQSFGDIQKALQPIMPQLRMFAQFLGGVLLTAIILAIGLIAGLVAAFAGLLKGAIQVVTGIIQFFSGLIQFFSGFFSLISDLFSGKWGKIAADLNTMMNGIMNMFIGIWNIIAGVFSAAYGMVVGFTQTFISTVVGIFQGLANTLVGHSIIPDMVNSIVNWFAQLPGRALSAIQSLAGMIGGFFGGLASQAIQWGSNIINNVATGIRNAMGNVAGAIGDVTAFIAAHLPHSPAKIGPLRDLVQSGEQITAQLSQGMLKAMPHLQTSLSVMLSPMSTSGLGSSSFSGGSAAYQFPSMSAASSTPTIIVQQPDIILDGQRLTRVMLPHLATGIRIGTGMVGR